MVSLAAQHVAPTVFLLETPMPGDVYHIWNRVGLLFCKILSCLLQ